MILGSSYLDWALIGSICVIASVVSIIWLTPRRVATGMGKDLLSRTGIEDRVFLFDGPNLIEANTQARALIKTDMSNFNWALLRDSLVGDFPEFPRAPDEVQAKGAIAIAASGDNPTDRAECEWIDGITRVHLQCDISGRRSNMAPSQELKTLRLIMGQAPYPVWHVDSDGKLAWHNTAYDALRKKVGSEMNDPTHYLFSSLPETAASGRKTRTSIAIDGTGKKLWFDVSVVPQETGYLCYATDINAVVDAEVAQRNFVQTLAKTFAQLSIGLAIFDRNRQLALFNPALIDLTALPADFLSARPNLLSFFDRLRDQRMMPEPKNYGSWRHQMADLVAAATDGRYQETWTLPSGAVYSVSGRPHPDGAVAFLFEDITAEITLTRRFRTDLEVSQSILDQLPNAIAVFSENGALCFSNIAYRRLWNVDPEASFVQITVQDAAKIWQDRCMATPVLGEIREFVDLRENRAAWDGPVQLKSGQKLTCAVFPISHGATMVEFKSTSDASSAAPVPSDEPETELTTIL